MSIVTIDIGATFLKFASWDLEGMKCIDSGRQPFPPFVTGLGARCREVEPREILHGVKTILEEHYSGSDLIEGIYLSAQMHGYVIWKGLGEYHSRFISWQDERGIVPIRTETAFDVIKSKVTPEITQSLGNEVRGSYCATSLVHRKLAGESLAGLYALSLGDFIVSELTRCDPVTSPSNASAHGLFNLESEDWHWDLIERLGLGELKWPRVAKGIEPVGYYAIRGKKIPVYLPIGDQQAAILGGLLTPEELSINIATGSQVSCLATDWRAEGCQVRPFPIGNYLKTVTHIPAGRSLNALIGLFSECALGLTSAVPDTGRIWDYCWTQAQKTQDPLPKVNLAFFSSAIGNTGEIAALSEGNLNVGAVFRGALNSMAENYWRQSENLNFERPWKKIVLSGSLGQTPLLTELIQSRFGLPTRHTPHDEDALFGLAVLAYHNKNGNLSWNETIQKLQSI